MRSKIVITTCFVFVFVLLFHVTSFAVFYDGSGTGDEMKGYVPVRNHCYKYINGTETVVGQGNCCTKAQEKDLCYENDCPKGSFL